MYLKIRLKCPYIWPKLESFITLAVFIRFSKNLDWGDEKTNPDEVLMSKMEISRKKNDLVFFGASTKNLRLRSFF